MSSSAPEEWLVSPRGPIRRESVESAVAFTRWQSHRDRFVETGLWPLIVPKEDLERLAEAVGEQAESTVADLIRAQGLNAATVFEDRRAWYREEMDEEEREEYDANAPSLDFDPNGLSRTEMPAAEDQISVLRDDFGAQDGVEIVLVSCGAPWELPAILGRPGGDLYPPPAHHVAALREWHSRHGAEPLVMGGDTVELLVRPIEDPKEAKRVAIEQYVHCEDIVEQGTQTVQALAAGLLGASVWFFWWD